METSYMEEAIKEAKKAYEIGEVPVGCVIVYNNQIIARGFNQRESKNMTDKHAEMIAINEANKFLNSWRLDGASMYVTLEPCPMCAGAIINARISNLYYGAKEPKSGSVTSIINLFDYKFNHHVNVVGGLLEEDIKKMMKDFFKEIRK